MCTAFLPNLVPVCVGVLGIRFSGRLQAIMYNLRLNGTASSHASSALTVPFCAKVPHTLQSEEHLM